MATTIGTEKDITTLIRNLIYLDHDAVDAYAAAIERLESAERKQQLSEFKADHERHIEALGRIGTARGIEVPEGGDMKRFLTQGKVAIGQLMGDKGILRAMKSNEEDTTTAYDRAAERDDLDAEIKAVIDTAQGDEHRHKAWLEAQLQRLG